MGLFSFFKFYFIFKLYNIVLVLPNIVFSTVENYAVLSMIENGLGMSVMNRLVTRKWDCDAAMLPLDPPKTLTLGIAVPDWDQASPAVRRFVEYAVKQLSQAEG